jgi:hypothetical protein
MAILRTTARYAHPLCMKKDWHRDELVQHWLLSPDEHALLGESVATRIHFAILLKDEIDESVVGFVAKQVGVQPELYFDGDWSERTQRLYRARVRGHCGFQMFRAEHEEPFVTWLSERSVHRTRTRKI